MDSGDSDHAVTELATTLATSLATAHSAREDARLAERYAAMDRYARRMAHDLNNFATVIRTYSELLLGELPPDGPMTDDVGEIHRAADAMVTYVQRSTRFARASRSRESTIAIDPIITDTVATFATDREHATVVRASDAVHGLSLRTEGAWLLDVLRELVRNACEASPKDRTVTIDVRSHAMAGVTVRAGVAITAGDWLVFSVSDEGSGFPSSMVGDAEDPFVTSKEGQRGAGFGLTMASSFARVQGGHLTRERIDGRTVVSLWLPAT